MIEYKVSKYEEKKDRVVVSVDIKADTALRSITVDIDNALTPSEAESAIKNAVKEVGEQANSLHSKLDEMSKNFIVLE